MEPYLALSHLGLPRRSEYRELGPMQPKAVAAVVKRAAHAAGIDPARFGAHSLRRDHAQQARRSGADFIDLKNQGGWASDHMVERYAREGRRFIDTSATRLGL